MTAVWALELPPSEKFVLLALADNANDEGMCWPSVATICAKTSLAERTVRGIIGRLQETGQIAIVERYGRSNVFTVTPALNAPLHSAQGAPAAPPPLQQVQRTPASAAPTPAANAPIIIKESSSEPSSESSITSSPEFLDLKIVYPTRAGDQAWRKAARAINARLAEGHTWRQILDGAAKYATHIRSTGNEGTQWVKQASAFVGTDRHFMTDWQPVPTKAGIRLKSNLSAAEEFMRRTEPALET